MWPRILKWALGLLLEIPLSTQQGTQQALNTPSIAAHNPNRPAVKSTAYTSSVCLRSKRSDVRLDQSMPDDAVGQTLSIGCRPGPLESRLPQLVEVPACSAGERRHEKLTRTTVIVFVIDVRRIGVAGC